MNFVELGALGEVVAALATVGTLGYLAVQIRLSNKLAISSIEHNLNTRVYDRVMKTTEVEIPGSV